MEEEEEERGRRRKVIIDIVSEDVVYVGIGWLV